LKVADLIADAARIVQPRPESQHGRRAWRPRAGESDHRDGPGDAIVLGLPMGAAEYGYTSCEISAARCAGPARAKRSRTRQHSSVNSAVSTVMTAQGFNGLDLHGRDEPASVNAVYTSYPITVTISCN